MYLWGVFLFLQSPYAWQDFPLDDAWIHRVYSRSLAAGEGFSYNPGSPETGETSPLWAILTAPAHWLDRIDPKWGIAGVKCIGIILGLGILAFAFRIAHFLTRSTRVSLAVSSLFALEPRLLFSTLSGMETVLLVFLWMIAFDALLRRRWVRFTLFMSLTPLTRPEAFLFLPFLAVCLPFLAKKTPWYKLIFLSLFLFAPTSFWGLACFSCNGNMLPNAFFTKAKWLHHGSETLMVAVRALTEHGLTSLALFPIGLGALLLHLRRRQDSHGFKTFVGLLALPAMYLFSIVCTRKINLGGYYYWSRWIDPVALVFSFALCLGLGFLLFAAIDPRTDPPARPRRSVMVLTVFSWLALLVSIPAGRETFLGRAGHLHSDSRVIRLLNVEAGKWIAEHTPAHDAIGVNDAGAIRYFGNRTTIDLVGINNSRLVHGRTTFSAELMRASWIAIFPGWFEESQIVPWFDLRTTFSIPLAEHTISHSPNQTTIAIFEKRKE